MARSQKDDSCYSDMQHPAWNYRAETNEGCTAGSLNSVRNAPPLIPNAGVMSDNMYVNANSFNPNDVYMNTNSYMSQQTSDNCNKDDNLARGNNVNNYAMLNLGNGQLVRVFYDENNKRLMIPVTGQYELFNHNQGLRDMPLQSPTPSHMFTLNQDYSVKDNNNVNTAQPTTASQSIFSKESNASSPLPTSSFLKEVICNWEPNSSGTYSPFGQNYPLNHPDAPQLNSPNPMQNHLVEPPIPPSVLKTENSPKRNDVLGDKHPKKRIVAEVKPMRPTYSDVLAKNAKNTAQTEPVRKVKTPNHTIEPKIQTKINSKTEKLANSMKHSSEEDNKKHKNDSKKVIITSSGSESGDVNTDDMEKQTKSNKKSKNKKNNMSRRWSSLDDVTKEDEQNSQTNANSQFVFIETTTEKPAKKDKKYNEFKHMDSFATDESFKIEEDDDSEFMFQDNPTETMKARKKKEGRSSSYKSVKQSQEKKKVTQNKWKKNKPGYMGLVHNYVEHWGGATWKAVVWFWFLLSDICRMSAHLSFDLCTSAFTQTYVSSQAVWRSSKDWVRKLADNKVLLYIDRKFGHTRFAFWKRWVKKDVESDDSNDSSKLNANIPLPATGEEAMKRLLACKGKDPYSILGVSVTCTDEEIKRYYRRQAFLVHPDKNQQPGAEEAFKILQHAFDLIGEPERRSAYGRRAMESQHVEAAWSELSSLLAQLHDKMEFAANTIRCTNCGRRHKRVLTGRPCYAARYCAQCKIRHSAKEGDIWAESSMLGFLVMYYACMDGAVYQITQWATCQKKNLKQLRPDCHVVQYRIVLGNKANSDMPQRQTPGHDPNLEEFLNNLYSKSGIPTTSPSAKQPSSETNDAKKRRNKKTKP